jgi:mono/diheme cytochrome c family protein
MKKTSLLGAGFAFVWVAFVSAQQSQPAAPRQQPVAAAVTAAADGASLRALLDQNCVACHTARVKSGGVALDGKDLSGIVADPAVWERSVRKLRAGMMPPAGSALIDPAQREAFAAGLEAELDRHATPQLPPPGLHRLNRTEYSNVIRDLLALNVDASKFLPTDDSTAGFDNQAGTLVMSPPLLEAYVAAAGRISRLAVGAPVPPTQVVYRVPEDATQDYHVEGLPFGTRGGLVIHHPFPTNGEFALKIVPVNKGNMGSATAFGEVRGEKLEILIDGVRVKLLDWDKEVARGGTLDLRVPVTAGPHTVGVTFLATQYAPVQDINKHFLRSTIETGGLPGFTFFPHIGSVRIDGPYDAAAATDTPSRRAIFVCRPTREAEEPGPASAKATARSRRSSRELDASEGECARKILSTLARRAYRRPAGPDDVDALMAFYRRGREQGSFDRGIEMALRRLLADPEFLYRKESEPSGLVAGRTYQIADLDLASRLSFFLWSSIPDNELLTLAEKGRLSDAAVLEKQVKRMLADPKADALIGNVAGQWLNLRALQTQAPVVATFPDFDDNLRQAFRRETELFFGSIVHEDRSILDLLDADYTFVNERLAIHYGIPNVYGSQFRRVTLPPQLDMRRGLLGQGSQLTVSSQPGRTSPVQRGKWFMQTFLGVSPPSPPPGVVIRISTTEKDAHGGTKLSMRQQMEAHRTTEPCKSCHKIMDPIGFTFENFDAVGKWRTEDGGVPVDTSGVIVDGTKVVGVQGIRAVALRYSPQFVRVATEKLMIYALGRGVEYFDMPVIRQIVRDAEPTRYRFSNLVLGVVRSPQFRMNVKTSAAPLTQVGQR